MRLFAANLALILAISCAPATGGPASNNSAPSLGNVAVSLDLTDAYNPGTILASTGDDRSDGWAHMAVNFWIEDNSGAYVKTVKYFLATETSHNTLAGTYTATGTHSAYTHVSTVIGDPTAGIARAWLNKAASHAGVDGMTGATIYVKHDDTPEGHFAATWDGKDYQGNPVASGIYHIKLLVIRHSGVQYGAVLHSFAVDLSASATTSTEESGFPVAYDSSATTTTTLPSTLDNTDSNFSIAFTHS